MRAIVLLLVAACSVPPPSTPSARLPAGATLVDFESAQRFAPGERYRGKVTVLDFWAGWCAECKRTVPQVRRLAAAFAADGLVVVGVNAGEERDDAARIARELEIDYPIALDPDTVFAEQLGAVQLPLLLVVDGAGAVVHTAKQVDAPTLAVIRRLLGR